MTFGSQPLPIAVLISGSGSNLQAIINHIQQKKLNAVINGVISNKPNVTGLQRAEAAGIPTYIIDNRDYPNRETYDRALGSIIDQLNVKLIVMAGFMRILSDFFVDQYRGQLINIHPSLLPKYPGLHTHRKVISHGDKYHGTSIHFVTEELDGGPIIAQKSFQVPTDATEDKLMDQVKSLEHQLYPLVIQWFADGRISLIDNKISFDGTTDCRSQGVGSIRRHFLIS